MQIFSTKSKGFTLIELLVVIAIIGILSSIVLVSVNSARNKAKDAAIKGNVEGTRVAAELFYDNGSTYAGVCTSGDFARIGSAVQAQASTWACNASGVAGYCASGSLTGGTTWCADSNGYSGAKTCGVGGVCS